ncbi:hypothetical protein CWC05_01245 [Pseudoalteromonas ruthenica]|uniref:AprE-like beta-barrel domain-containing protein n=1 Tax=Pseudoalteromonas ruthenica TaxID=151081 RepID=A0A5S3Z9U3_9GAMM|nr:biotin/lipoyl-binding protein [Pseudoalteromonas ruthenica]TMP89009.1 hypothetical protein CWC05_01245 [Pseudoalteromonas ruthenica]
MSKLLRSLVFLVISFLLLLYLILKLLFVNDYTDPVDGVILADPSPVKIKSTINGSISELFASHNEKVKKGQILAIINGDDLTSNKEQIHSEYIHLSELIKLKEQLINLSEQEIVRAEKSINFEIARHKAQKKLDAFLLKVAESELNSESNSAASKLSYELNNNIVKSTELLSLSDFEKLDLISKSKDAIDKIRNKDIKYNKIAYEMKLKEAEFNLTLSKLNKEKTKALKQANITEQEYRELKVELTKVQDRMRVNDFKISKTFIKSPIEGNLTYISEDVKESKVANKNQVSFIVTPENNNFYVELYLPDQIYKEVSVGHTVNIEVFAWNHYKHGIITGQIQSITKNKVPSTHHDTPAYLAKVEIDRSDKTQLDLQQGFTIKARVVLGEVSILSYIIKKLNLDDK